MVPEQNTNNSEKTKEFLTLYTRNQKRIYGYILSVISAWSDAEDIMQETTALMWQKFEDFQPGSNFAGWGIQIAKFKIREFRRKVRKDIDLSDEVFEMLLEKADQFYTTKDTSVTDALEHCLRKLPMKDYRLIQMRYIQQTTIKDIALQMERPVQGLYKVMSRIHSVLVACVQRNLKAREAL